MEYVSSTTGGFGQSNLPEYFAAFAANLGAFAFGTVMSWSATALPDIRDDLSIGNLTLSEESLVASSVTLGALVSGPVSGYTVDFLGRRSSMLLLTMPFVLGWTLIYFAVDVMMIYVGRFLTGACGTALTIVAPLYISEISSPGVRGLLAAGFEVMTNVGILFMFILGSFFSWRNQALACASVPLVFGLLIYSIPPSPRFLLGKGRREEALTALKWFKRHLTNKGIEAELNELEEDMNRCSSERTPKSMLEAWRAIVSPGNIRPVLIILGLFVVESFSGEDPMLFYLVDLFDQAGTSLDSFTSAIVIAVIQLIASLGAAFAVDRSGRRVLLIASLGFMAVSLGSLALYFYLKTTDETVTTSLSWLPLMSIALFIVSDNIGLGPMIYLIMGELLPHNVRGVASSMLMSVKWLLAFSVVQNFESILVTIGDAEGISLFAIFCLLGLLFIVLYVPETKGRSLEEIQQDLKGNHPESYNFSSSDTESSVFKTLRPESIKYGSIST